ncbi:tetratricopeptide repeat protein [Thermodesulfatator atlanticus]|uniref:tetratricopeptide repeat protein n=1 Tax=Thermodesulfatator atlanticus TaxID=501497 RepID=UPI0003B46ACC|nr:tetratricopeptide repeat protein [Thermodesulfatator atlanticus]
MSKLFEAIKKLENNNKKIESNINKRKEQRRKKIYPVITCISIMLGIISILLANKAYNQKNSTITRTQHQRTTEKTNLLAKEKSKTESHKKIIKKDIASTAKKKKTASKNNINTSKVKETKTRKKKDTIKNNKKLTTKNKTNKTLLQNSNHNTAQAPLMKDYREEVYDHHNQDNLHYIKPAKEVHTENYKTLLALAEEKRKDKQFKEALYFYQKALSEPNLPHEIKADILNNVGAIYLINSNYKKACKVLEEASRIKNDDIIAKNLVVCYLNLKNYRKACSIISHMIQKNPHNKNWQEFQKGFCQ